LFCRCEESHHRRLAFLSTALFDELDILIDLDRVEGFLLEFPDPFIEIGGIGTLGSLDVVAKMSVHVGAFSFKVPTLGPYESKEMIGLVNTKLKVYELPDWQNLDQRVQITSPQ